MRQLFDPNFGMFQRTEGGVYWFRASSLELSMEFELVGTLLGLAIFNHHILDIAFPTLVYQCVFPCPSLSCNVQQWTPESGFSQPSKCARL